ncbi:MAG: UvrD-helicase domain-containing protein [Kiritimatiellia bacterium]
MIKMSILQNTLIKASAGTGKTYTLATHMIRMLLIGVEPQHIVALTFSRAAAGEIFNKLANRLAAAASSEEGAQAESSTVFDGITPELEALIVSEHGRSLKHTCFQQLLRKVIESQHISMIGTLDSFMFRMIQSFPLELGFQGPTTIMDSHHVDNQISLSTAAILYRREHTREIRDFMEAFRLAEFGKENKSYFSTMIRFVNEWHSVWCEMEKYGAQAWGLPSNIWPEGTPWIIHGQTGHLADELRSRIRPTWETEYAKGAEQWDQFCEFVENFNNTLPDKPAGIANVLRAYIPGSGSIEIKYGHKKLVFTGSDAELINKTIETLLSLILQACCNTTQGIFRIIDAYEKVYNRNTRRRGLMTFNDIPQLISGLDKSIRQNIEYRFDTRFRHWALDEFQDTSHAQWNAVRELVDEVIQSVNDERSVFIVGDIKQAIYGWRGGDVSIFNGEADSGLYKLQELNVSYRYSPEIADLVNRVFNGDHIHNCLKNSAPQAGGLWRHNWADHESEQAPGYVQVERVEATPRGTPQISGWIEETCKILRHMRPWEREISAAVLVRSNSQGYAFADALKSEGIPAVWEGENAICDTPVVTALLHVLLLAEHPGHKLAWRHICASPLAEKTFRKECALPQEDGCAALSAKVLSDVSRRGLSRTLLSYIEKFVSADTDDFTRSRLDDLIRAACEFTTHSESEYTLTDFAEYAGHFVNRDKAGASTVKILTVHRSKGLGFDYVIVPVIENTGFTTPPQIKFLKSDSGRWVLHPPPRMLINLDKKLSAAWDQTLNNSIFEELCVMYVAMTRAKRAMTILLKPPPGKNSRTDFFSDYTEQALEGELPYYRGDPRWYMIQAEEKKQIKSEDDRQKHIKRGVRRELSRITPSRSVLTGINAASLFSRSENRAMLKGTRIHEALRRIEWLEEPFSQPDGIDRSEIDLLTDSELRKALTRPNKLCDLWRERSFEIILNKRWISGTFDRVVFAGDKNNMQAEIMDFKTNRVKAEENPETFHKRMRQIYAPQMNLYREALEKLTGIPTERITVSLLLTETRERVEVLQTL